MKQNVILRNPKKTYLSDWLVFDFASSSSGNCHLFNCKINPNSICSEIMYAVGTLHYTLSFLGFLVFCLWVTFNEFLRRFIASSCDFESVLRYHLYAQFIEPLLSISLRFISETVRRLSYPDFKLSYVLYARNQIVKLLSEMISNIEVWWLVY